MAQIGQQLGGNAYGLPTLSREDRKRNFIMQTLTMTKAAGQLSDRVAEGARAFEELERLCTQATGEG